MYKCIFVGGGRDEEGRWMINLWEGMKRDKRSLEEGKKEKRDAALLHSTNTTRKGCCCNVLSLDKRRLQGTLIQGLKVHHVVTHVEEFKLLYLMILERCIMALSMNDK